MKRNTLLYFCFFFASCSKLLPGEPAGEEVLAGPIEGLSQEQVAVHFQGDAEFARVFSAADGLGPVFVSTSCESCHAGDGKGHPVTTLTRFGRYNGSVWDSMKNFGGPQLQNRAIAGYLAEQIPQEATGSTKLVAPAVTGLGYLEAVPDAAIFALADPSDADGDGISGVPSYVTPPDFFQPQAYHTLINGKYIGRFGKKGGAIDLLQQTVGAYVEDMGITSDFHMQDLYNVQSGNFTGDQVPDPEVSSSAVNNLVFYMRTLKIPPRRNSDDPIVKQGEKHFNSIGCAKCHTPALTTGSSELQVLANKTIYPYTDLLLHDMGPELDDNYAEGSALPAEWKTPALWGIGLVKDSQGGKAFYLHDGRAKSLEEAIQFHGGEAADSRAAYNALTAAEKTELIRFLESL